MASPMQRTGSAAAGINSVRWKALLALLQILAIVAGVAFGVWFIGVASG